MRSYSTFRPTANDPAGLNLDDRQAWLVVPCGRNRDSDCLTESNWHAALALLGGEGENVEVHNFGHWACGWFEIMIVRPGSPAEAIAEGIESRLSDYPILNEDDHTEREQVAADETWRECYSPAERIAYIRRYASQFEFSDFADLLGCVRGRYFAGYASELVNR